MNNQPPIYSAETIRANKFITELKNSKKLYEISKSYQNILFQYAKKASPENPIIYLIPSCPNYSEFQGRTNYESMLDGVPSMAKQTVDETLEFIQALETNNIPFQVKILIADQEVGDDTILKSMQIEPLLFLRNIMSSKQATQEYVNSLDLFQKNEVLVTTFMSEFNSGLDISKLEQEYIQQINLNLNSNSKEASKLNRTIEYTIGIESDRIEMLHQRLAILEPNLSFETVARNKIIYNLAQYLALGDVASKKYKFPVIGITDPRLPINARNQPELKLEKYGKKDQPTIPLISFK